MDLDGVLDELYGAPPERFTARRDELARQARADGDKDLAATVHALRRPTAAAWVVNCLARQAPEAVGGLVELGMRMREAQSVLSGSQMRTLSRERQRVLADLVRQGDGPGRRAGQPVGGPGGRGDPAGGRLRRGRGSRRTVRVPHTRPVLQRPRPGRHLDRDGAPPARRPGYGVRRAAGRPADRPSSRTRSRTADGPGSPGTAATRGAAGGGTAARARPGARGGGVGAAFLRAGRGGCRRPRRAGAAPRGGGGGGGGGA